MSKKRLSDRLDNLFADLNTDTGSASSTPGPQPVREKLLSGWIWMCDADGRFVACSPEVAGLLGVQPDDFIGQPLQSFRLPLESAQALQTAIKERGLPIEIDLDYEAPGGQLLPVSMHIFPASSVSGEKPGWRGFTISRTTALEAAQPIPAEVPPSQPNDTNITTQHAVTGMPGLKREPVPTSYLGFLAVGKQLIPADFALTDAGKEILDQNRPDARRASSKGASIMAVSRSLNEGSKILLEILDQSLTRKWSEDEQKLLDQIAGELSLALENALLSERIQATLASLKSFYQAAAELNAVKNFHDILGILRKHTLFRNADKLLSLNLFNRPWVGDDIPEWNLPVARWTTLKQEDLSTRHSMRAFPAYRLISQDVVTFIEDVARDPRLDRNMRAIYMDRFQAKSTLLVPLVVSEKWIGMIEGVFGKTTKFQADEVRHLMGIANLAAVAVQSLKNFGLAEHRAQEIQRRGHEIGLIHRVATAISTSPNLQEVMQIVATLMAKALPVQRIKIAILNEERRSLVILADYPDTPVDTRGVGVIIPVEGDLFTQQILATRKPLAIPDAQSSPLTSAIHTPLRQLGIHSMVVFPLLNHDQVIGTIELDFLEKGRTLRPEEMQLSEIILIQTATAVQNIFLSNSFNKP